MLSDSLKVFITVADKKNFSKAAKALNLTQPAISFQIQTLEQYYQTKLFDRINRHVKLTETGELLLEYALSMSDLQFELERKMQQLTGHVKGRLMIGASRTIGEYILPYVICKYKEAYPDVDVTLEIYNTKHVEENVLSKHLDIGLVESEIKHKELFYQNILSDELVLVLPKSHRLADAEELSIEDVKSEPFIIREAGSGSRLVFEQALIDAEIDIEELNVIMEIGSITSIKLAIINGLGISIMSRWAARDLETAGLASIVRLKNLNLERSFSIILNPGNFESEACHKFIRYLGEITEKELFEHS